MGKNGRGRGNSSSLRGRGQNGSLHRTKKSSSPDPRRPSIVLTAAVDSSKSTSSVTVPSSIVTRQMANRNKQQQQSGGGQSTSNPGTSTLTVPTSNDFELLSDNDDDDEGDDDKQSSTNTPIPAQGKTTPKLKRNPPISVLDLPAAKIDKVLMDGDCEFAMRILRTSVKVYTFGRPMFEKSMEALAKAGIPYYTHEPADQSAVKVVLSGYNIPSTPEELKKSLKEQNVNPREAKVLSRKKTVTGNHFLWLLYFDRGSVKIQDLRKVKAVEGFLVGWRYFTKRPTDAAQCHRCQRFGHGSRFCTLAPKCVKCGDAHLTASCALPRKEFLDKDKTAEQQKEKVKCANCDGNHTANYRGCTARKTYLEALEKRKTPATQQPLRTSTGRPSTGNPNPPGFSRTYASVAANGNGPAPDNTSDGGLFTLTEFLSLARDMFSRLSSCQSKLEQFCALQELMAKYLGTA